jgi:hypothetical protein
MAAEYEGWAIVELMGHRKLAGDVREVTIAGCAFLRLDVPSDPPVTQYYGGAAIYCITPTTEALARQVAQASRPAPIQRYELPAPPARTRSDVIPDDLDEDGYDDREDAEPYEGEQ